MTVRQREGGADAGEMIVGRYPLSLDLTALLPGQEREATAEIPREFLEESGLWSVRIWAGIENPEPGRPEVLLAMQAQRRGKCADLLNSYIFLIKNQKTFQEKRLIVGNFVPA